MRKKVEDRLVQARFIEIHQLWQKKKSDIFLTERYFLGQIFTGVHKERVLKVLTESLTIECSHYVMAGFVTLPANSATELTR